MKKIIFSFMLLFSVLVSNNALAEPIKIATFNIQNLGITKMSRPVDVQAIVGILQTYDIVAVQEISDSHNRIAVMLLQQLNRSGRYRYNVSVSPRTGRQGDDITKAEQYAFYYRTDLVEILESHLYDDEQYDYFGREPWVARFRTLQSHSTFVLITIHTVPAVTLNEMNALHYVVEDTRHIYLRENNYIVLGDMNAACEYANPRQVSTTLIRGPQYLWIVPDSADTNLASRQCAFDRIVLTQELRPFFRNVWGVNTAVTRTVSDHYPVWFQLEF
jgi:endonuclease/exonuclease/phosphatase family metal-dependent hydrolase